MGVSRWSYLSRVGTWLVGFAALATGLDSTTADPLLVACSPEQPIVRAGDRVSLKVRAWASAPKGASWRYLDSGEYRKFLIPPDFVVGGRKA